MMPLGGLRGRVMSRAAPTIFDFPLSLIGNGLEGFWRFDPGSYSIDTGIDAVDDRSGLDRHYTQPLGVLQPDLGALGSRPCAAFDGTRVMIAPTSFGTAMDVDEWSIWAFLQTDTTSSSQYATTTSNGGGPAISVDSAGTGERECTLLGVGELKDGTATTAIELIAVARLAGTIHMFVNGSEVALADATAGPASPSGTAWLGGRNAVPIHGWSGKIAEYGGVSRALTGTPGVGNPCTGELASLWTYVQDWYGV